jgi:N-acetylneuraminic acid mutarotase
MSTRCNLPLRRSTPSGRKCSSLIEGLDARTLFCAPPPVMPTLGGAVPWLTPPITAAAPNASASASWTTTAGAPAVASPRVLASSPAPIRINAGGPAYTDSGGVAWVADRNFSGGAATTSAFPVANTTSDQLYLDRRYGSFNYNIPIATPGSYTLNLHFMEPSYTTAGKRKFSVKAEGATILSDFDITTAGGGRAALVKTFSLSVTDGTLNLQFIKNIDNPVVSAIEVIAQQQSPPPPPAAGFTNLTYTTKTSGLFPTAESLTAKFDSRMYVFGGFSGSKGPVTASEFYDTADNTWHAITKLPQPITHAGMAQDDQNAYFIGGYVGKGDGTGYAQTFGSNKVWSYNFATDSYSSLPNLPKQLAGGGAALIDGKLHYFGGYNLDRTDTTIHLVLDLNNLGANWKTAAPMPHARSHLGSVVFGGKIYAIAGQIGNDENLVTKNYVEVFDPATGAWSAKTSMPQAISHMASASFVMDDRIIIMGGETAHNVPTRAVYAYTPATNSWQTLTSLPAARFSGVANTFGGKIYFAQGGGSQATTWLATPA